MVDNDIDAISLSTQVDNVLAIIAEGINNSNNNNNMTNDDWSVNAGASTSTQATATAAAMEVGDLNFNNDRTQQQQFPAAAAQPQPNQFNMAQQQPQQQQPTQFIPTTAQPQQQFQFTQAPAQPQQQIQFQQRPVYGQVNLPQQQQSQQQSRLLPTSSGSTNQLAGGAAYFTPQQPQNVYATNRDWQQQPPQSGARRRTNEATPLSGSIGADTLESLNRVERSHLKLFVRYGINERLSPQALRSKLDNIQKPAHLGEQLGLSTNYKISLVKTFLKVFPDRNRTPYIQLYQVPLVRSRNTKTSYKLEALHQRLLQYALTYELSTHTNLNSATLEVMIALKLLISTNVSRLLLYEMTRDQFSRLYRDYSIVVGKSKIVAEPTLFGRVRQSILDLLVLRDERYNPKRPSKRANIKLIYNTPDSLNKRLRSLLIRIDVATYNVFNDIGGGDDDDQDPVAPSDNTTASGEPNNNTNLLNTMSDIEASARSLTLPSRKDKSLPNVGIAAIANISRDLIHTLLLNYLNSAVGDKRDQLGKQATTTQYPANGQTTFADVTPPIQPISNRRQPVVGMSRRS